jgi:hypothetical protein
MANAPYQYDFFQMSPDDYERLMDSIQKNGLRPGYEPVIDQDGNIIDGHHRAKACAELGISYTPIKMSFATEEDRRKFVLDMNCSRRHLTIDQKRAAAHEYYRLYPEMSFRAIGKAVGLSATTVSHSVNPRPSVQIGQHEDERRTPVAVADHRNESWLSVTFGYPKESEVERKRRGFPYKRESDREEDALFAEDQDPWAMEEFSTNRVYLTKSWPPTTKQEAKDALNEAVLIIYKRVVEKYELA